MYELFKTIYNFLIAEFNQTWYEIVENPGDYGYDFTPETREDYENFIADSLCDLYKNLSYDEAMRIYKGDVDNELMAKTVVILFNYYGLKNSINDIKTLIEAFEYTDIMGFYDRQDLSRILTPPIARQIITFYNAN